MKPPQNTPPSDPRHKPPPGHSIDPARWLSTLPDDWPIGDINIPGSHNAAAINTKRSTRWACQRHSITEQLQKGIRLLDIRLKPKRCRRDADTPLRRGTGTPLPREAHAPSYEFVTCHGHLGPFGANEFQHFDSLLEECTAFLNANPRETIIMTIRIDDWHTTRKIDHPQVLKALQTSLTGLPLLLTSHMPSLKDCRGRIFLINRINDDHALGAPINIPDNTPGTTLQPTAQRQYQVYIQDQYKKLNRQNPEAHKLRLTIEAQEKKSPGTMLLNFASATKPFGRFVYINEDLLQYLIEREHPDEHPDDHTGPRQIGWLLLDYPFGRVKQTTVKQSPLDLAIRIIASNDHP
ncbi:MAG TPA: phosphatidylinositol-specific phospholipase C domain-containing protein [Puia sp.]|nr:phosphatidylinositol-specific phospholipase C domain-containing protein [Puia sp.]